MLDKQLVKRLDKDGCFFHQESYQRELDLTNRRLERLRKKQEINPTFQAYDVWADAPVDISTRVEEWEAIKDELEWYLELLSVQLNALEVKEKFPESKRVGADAHQLSMLDTLKERL